MHVHGKREGEREKERGGGEREREREGERGAIKGEREKERERGEGGRGRETEREREGEREGERKREEERERERERKNREKDQEQEGYRFYSPLVKAQTCLPGRKVCVTVWAGVEARSILQMEDSFLKSGELILRLAQFPLGTELHASSVHRFDRKCGPA